MNPKCFYVIKVLLLVLVNTTGFAQGSRVPVQIAHLEPLPVAVSFSKTTNILFPYAIKSADLGSGEVNAQLAPEVGNLLQLKAGIENFAPTNLSVVTADNCFYSFLLHYDPDPRELNVLVLDPRNEHPEPRLKNVVLNEAVLKETASGLLQQHRVLGKKTRSQSMQLQVENIWVYDQTIWFTLGLENESLIDYEPASVRFFIRERQRHKRTAIQDKEIVPLIRYGESKSMGMSKTRFVCAFPVFTLATSQYLLVQVREQAGGRALDLRINPRLLLRARPLTCVGRGGISHYPPIGFQ